MKIPEHEDMTQAQIDVYELAVDYGLTDDMENMFREIEQSNGKKNEKIERKSG